LESKTQNTKKDYVQIRWSNWNYCS